MKTIAIPVFGRRISPRLDCADTLLLFRTENGRVMQRQQLLLSMTSSLERAAMLKILGIDVLICGGLTKAMANRLRNGKLEIISWVSGEAEQILARYLAGEVI